MKNYMIIKRLIFLSLNCFMVILVTGCTPSQEPIPVERLTPFDWEKNIIPGQTSSSELVSIWGEPDEIVNVDWDGAPAKEFSYVSTPYEPDDLFVIFDYCDCVVIYLIDIIERYHEPYLYLSDLIENYGDPEAVTISSLRGKSNNFIYATQGVTITAQDWGKPESSTVFSIQYFVPMSMDEYMKSWGRSDDTSLPNHSIWKAYEVSNNPDS